VLFELDLDDAVQNSKLARYTSALKAVGNVPCVFDQPCFYFGKSGGWLGHVGVSGWSLLMTSSLISNVGLQPLISNYFAAFAAWRIMLRHDVWCRLQRAACIIT